MILKDKHIEKLIIINEKLLWHNGEEGEHIGNMVETTQARFLEQRSFILEQTNYRQRGTGGRRNNTNRTLKQIYSQRGVWTCGQCSRSNSHLNKAE